MKALDTNVLVRFLVQDDEIQASKVDQLFASAEQGKETLFIPLLVVLELIWVLQSAYGVQKKGYHSGNQCFTANACSGV